MWRSIVAPIQRQFALLAFIRFQCRTKSLNSDFTERCHGLVVDGGLRICGGEVWSGVVPALVIVVLHIQAGEFGEADSQGTTGVVDVLPIQRLKMFCGCTGFKISLLHCYTR